MKPLPTHDQIKETVRNIWLEALKIDESVKLAHLYEQAAHHFGYKNWDTFSAILKLKDKEQS